MPIEFIGDTLRDSLGLPFPVNRRTLEARSRKGAST